MSSNFFIRKSKGGTKRKINSKNKLKIKQSKKTSRPNIATKGKHKTQESDEISSEEESIQQSVDEESDDNLVTAQEKKINLAKRYLEEIEKEEKERLESEDVQGSVINRLKNDLLDQAGKLSKKVADKLIKPEAQDLQVLRCKDHKLSITCIVIDPCNMYFYSASKDAVIVKWSIGKCCKVGVIPSKHQVKDIKCKEYAHDSSILSLAISFEGKYLASGDEGSDIRVWQADSLTHLHSFKGHRSSVTGLSFCPETNHLYSCSKDRSIRIWNLDEMSFVETLFGHQCCVTGIDVLKRDRAITSGGSDNTLRVWKVQEESQLIFNGHKKSIDGVRRLDDQHFISCGDDGLICIWGILKKKPLSVISNAHGTDLSNNEPNWISSVSCLSNSDLIVSGSSDGHLRFWKCEENYRNVAPLFTVPVVGFLNNVSFSKDGNFLIVGVGQEHRLGRWFVEKKAKNSILLIKLQYSGNFA